MSLYNRILAIDPGKSNAYYVLVQPKRVKLIILETAKIPMCFRCPIDTLLVELKKQIVNLVKTTKPDFIIAERFITRPRGGRGNTSEPVNLFLGMLYCEALRKKIPFKLVTASQHKRFRPETFVEDWKKQGYNEHQSDAISLSWWAKNKYSNVNQKRKKKK